MEVLWWGIAGSILEPRWLYGILKWWVGVPVRKVGIVLPSKTVSIGVRITLCKEVEIVHNVGVLFGRGTIIALNGGMSLHTTGLADSIDPN